MFMILSSKKKKKNIFKLFAINTVLFFYPVKYNTINRCFKTVEEPQTYCAGNVL